VVSMRNAVGAESSQNAALDKESEMGSNQGLWRFLHAIVGRSPESNFNNCCLAGTPFLLAVSFPGTLRP
jgi:hypothetical protein